MKMKFTVRFNKNTLIREMARERIGIIPSRKVFVSKANRIKHKKRDMEQYTELD